jgi:hypothetical protein
MIVAFLVAAFCVTAFLLITLAITRGVPRIVWVVGLCLVVGAIATGLVLREAMKPGGESKEIDVTRDYAASVRRDGFPISVERAFEASSFEGLHGDGASVTVYRYPPKESEELLAALKRKEPAFVWQDVPAETYEFSGLRRLLPPDFLPGRDSFALRVGDPADGVPVQEFVLDRSRGILYVIRNQF